MGEVYRARDSRLKCDVAIKVLPEQFSRDAERVARLMDTHKASSQIQIVERDDRGPAGGPERSPTPRNHLVHHRRLGFTPSILECAILHRRAPAALVPMRA